MYRVESEQVDLLVTPNHRMWVKAHDTQANKRGEEPYRVRHAERDLRETRRVPEDGDLARTGIRRRSRFPGTKRVWQRDDRSGEHDATLRRVAIPAEGVRAIPRPLARRGEPQRAPDLHRAEPRGATGRDRREHPRDGSSPPTSRRPDTAPCGPRTWRCATPWQRAGRGRTRSASPHTCTTWGPADHSRVFLEAYVGRRRQPAKRRQPLGDLHRPRAGWRTTSRSSRSRRAGRRTFASTTGRGSSASCRTDSASRTRALATWSRW